MNTPNIPNLPTGQLWTVAKNDASWLMRHERIVIVALVLIAGTFLGNKLLNWEGAQKDAKVAALTLVVEQDKASVQNLALAAQQAQAAYQTTLDAITKENASLAQANAQELASLAQRQTIDKSLPLPAVAQRIEVLVPATVGGVTATTAGVVMNDTASHGVLDALEQIPVLVDELKNETRVADNNEKALDYANTVITTTQAEVGALNKSLTDQQAHEVAAVAAEKLKAKKAWRSGFKWGFGLGFAAGAYIMHAL
jgi:hypothetical protein